MKPEFNSEVVVDGIVRRIIADSFNNIDEWEFNRYLLINRNKKISFWIANGLTFFNFDDNCKLPYRLNLIDKIYLWGKAKKLMRKIVVRQLSA